MSAVVIYGLQASKILKKRENDCKFQISKFLEVSVLEKTSSHFNKKMTK